MKKMETLWWTAIIAVSLVAIVLILTGCGLSYTPPGGTPPPGSKPVGEAGLDGATNLMESGWGDLAGIAAGFLGCGGVVAGVRTGLRRRKRRRKEQADQREVALLATRQKTALQEIIAGVDEILASSTDEGLKVKKEILGERQSSGTEDLVTEMKTT